MIRIFLQPKTAVCKAPNCSLDKGKLQFGALNYKDQLLSGFRFRHRFRCIFWQYKAML